MSFTAKLFASALLVLCLLGLALLMNTYRFRSRQIQVQPADEVKLDEEQVAERFGRALQFKTVSYPEPSHFDAESFWDCTATSRNSFPGFTRLSRER